MTELAVTDAHALIWYSGGKWKKLGPAAREVFGRAEQGRASIFVPMMVVVETLEADRRGTISIPGGAARWLKQIFDSGAFHPAELTAEIAFLAHTLYAIPERGDRLIAATAVALDLPLMTRDPEIARAAGVEILW